MKQNCWDFKKCGREPSGVKAKELGICPAAVEGRLTGVNSGANGGRACWAVTGTLCGGKVQGSFAAKVGSCMHCDFYQLVTKEEGASIVTPKQIIAKLAEA